jgi:predicted transcriptional regulator
MSTDLAVAHSEDQLDYALNLMRQRNIGHLPVVEEKSNHKLIGIITTSDIVGKYMENQNSFKQPQNDAPEHSK